VKEVTKIEIPIKNYHPYCVNLKLYLRESKEYEHLPDSLIGTKQHLILSSLFYQRLGKYIQTSLTILFGEEKLLLLGGSVRFGIRRGELEIGLHGASCPMEHRDFAPSISHYIDVKRKHVVEEEKETGGGENISAEVSIPLGVSVELESQERIASKIVIRKEIEFFDKIPVINTKGPDSRPVWTFQSYPGRRVLKGGLVNHDLCRIQLFDHGCTIEVFFKVDQSNIIITSVEGIYPDSLKKDTMGAIHALVLKWIRKQVRHVMSEGRIQHG